MTRRLVYYEQAPLSDAAVPPATTADQVAELDALVRHVAAGDGAYVRLLAHTWGSHLTLRVLLGGPVPVSHAARVTPLPLAGDRVQASFGRFVERLDPADRAEADRLDGLGSDPT